jgi:hypothetical protein
MDRFAAMIILLGTLVVSISLHHGSLWRFAEISHDRKQTELGAYPTFLLFGGPDFLLLPAESLV